MSYESEGVCRSDFYLQRIMIPEYGIFALDPGLSSAMAWGIVRDEGTVKQRVDRVTPLLSTTIKEINWVSQARQIFRLFSEFEFLCIGRGVPAYFVCEDFILNRFKSSDRTGLYPVWVGAAVVGYRTALADCHELEGYGRAKEAETIWQLPSQAKTFATDDRLRDFGLWVKGREHERDAMRHFAYFIAHSESQQLRLARARTGGRGL